jgi:PAS domain S-box-containing protein
LRGGGTLKIPNKETFSAGWSALEKRLMPSYVWASDPLTYWRERILFIICFFGTIFGPIALIPSLLLAYSEGLWDIVLIDSLTYVTVVAILIARNVSFVIRALVLCFIIYTLGISILFIMGPLGAGYIWLLGASVLISTFIGIGASIFTLAVNTIALLSVGIFIAYGNPAWTLHVDNSLKKWLVMSANFLILNVFITIITAFLQNGLKKALLLEEATNKSLRKSEEHYRFLTNNIPDIIYSIDGGGNIVSVNKSALERFGYTEQEATGKPFLYFVHPEDREILIKAALKDIVDMRKVTTDLQFRMVTKNGSSYWFEPNASSKFDSNDRYIGEDGVLRDITKRKRAEEELQNTLNSLRKAVSTTIQVLVSAIEVRDPYTAGHQRRTANLACAIAIEMELPPEKVEGIRMAGYIHDIGKLSLPSEILSKPTKLSDIEFALIKEHSRSGYEILKDVESPWPLAEMVYQHHERMDGSGYPRKLQGNDIIIEARILNVADVVEAMASNRPYRPSLGIDSALAEIEKYRGTIYDDAVVDACIRLFREKGFELESI